MNKLGTYRQIVREQIQVCALRFVQVDFEVTPIFDDERGHYLLMIFGRYMDKRMSDTILHLRLHNSKVWIERDDTADGIANALLEAGIPREEIVLAFHSPWKRQFTEFAVA